MMTSNFSLQQIVGGYDYPELRLRTTPKDYFFYNFQLCVLDSKLV